MRGDIRAQPLINRVVFGRGIRYSNTGAAGSGFFNDRWGAFTSYSLQTAATDGPPGTGLATYVRATFTGARPAGGFHMTGNSETVTPGYDNARRVQATPGEVLYISVWVRCSVSVINGQLRCKFTDAAGTSWAPGADGNTRALNFSLTGGVWTRLVFRLVVPPTAGWAAIMCVADFDTGHVFDATGFMAYGTATGNPDVDYGLYMDGYTPGWRWTGAAEGSTSIGWPYTLESIAGAPVASITGLGSVTLTLAQMPALSGRTIYVVTDRLALPGTGVAARFARGVLAQGGADLRSDGPSARYTYRPQYDGAGGGAGGAYSTGYIANVPAVGTRNVHCVAEMDGLTSYEHEVNGGTPVVKTGMVPGSGHTAPGLYTELGVDGTTTVESPVYAVQFVGGHSYETRKRVTAWLGRRYGSPIPAGY